MNTNGHLEASDFKKSRRQKARLDDPPIKERLPPHSDEAEQAALGCVILNADECLPKCEARFDDTGAFYDLRWRTVYESAIEMARAGLKIDTLTLSQHLKDDGNLDAVGGLAAIAGLPDKTPSFANIDFYLDIIHEKHQLRRLIQSCTDAISKAYEFQGDIDSMLDSVGRDMIRLTNKSNSFPRLMDASEFCNKAIHPPDQIIKNLLHRTCKLVFGGPSKARKSWVFLDLALSVSTGNQWLGFETTKSNVVFVNFELPEFEIHKRINQIARAKEIDVPRDGSLMVWNLRGYSAQHEKIIPRLIDGLSGKNLGLIILDPSYKLLGGKNENDAADISEMLNSFERLAVKTNAAIAFSAHFAKGNASGKDAMDRISGSGVFARDPDAILTATSHKEDDSYVIEMSLRTMPPHPPFVVTWSHPLMTLAMNLDPKELKNNTGRKPNYSSDSLLKILKEKGPLKSSEWLAIAKEEEGISKPTFDRLRRALIFEEKIYKSKVSGDKWQACDKKKQDYTNTTENRSHVSNTNSDSYDT